MSRPRRILAVFIVGAGLSAGIARALMDAGAPRIDVQYLQSRVATTIGPEAQAILCDEAQIYQRDLVQTPIDIRDLPKKQADFGRYAPFWCILGPSQGAPPAGNARPPAFS